MKEIRITPPKVKKEPQHQQGMSAPKPSSPMHSAAKEAPKS